jgi:hypothetical protein
MYNIKFKFYFLIALKSSSVFGTKPKKFNILFYHNKFINSFSKLIVCLF